MAGFRAGDWVCPACSNHNYANKVACNRCGAAKVGAQVAPGQGYGRAPGKAPAARPSPYGGGAAAPAKPGAMRPGDWCCPQCFNHNYASRTQCGKCHAPKMPHMHGAMGAMMGGGAGAMGGMQGGAGAQREGDWKCYGCGNLNYASRTEACNRCALPKTVYVSKSGMRPGDWVCPACHNHNWADRSSCMKCQTPKGANQVHTKGMRPGDWLCSQCNNHNFGSKDRCNRCQRPKQAGALTMPAA